MKMTNLIIKYVTALIVVRKCNMPFSKALVIVDYGGIALQTTPSLCYHPQGWHRIDVTIVEKS